MEYHTHTLKNGIRLIHKQVNSQVSHCGVIVNTGSRDEEQDEHGMAHLIEHMIFKGTGRRKAYHILSRMDDIGGEINAYTTKEETCIFTTFFKTYYPRAFDLLSDILFHSVFPVKEIEREKEVVIDEINSYKDSPVDLIFDDFEDLIFKGNSLGRSILGEEKLLKKITRGQILEFIDKNYSTSQMVVTSVGNISFPRLIKYFENYFGDYPEKQTRRERLTVNGYTPEKKVENRSTYQSHCMMGSPAYNLKDDRRWPLTLLNNLLGGPALNSRLNLLLREKNGIAYNVDSNYTPYSDTGLISIYFGADKKDTERAVSLILKELKKIREKPLGTLQLHKAKRQLVGQMAIASESYEHLMLTIGKSYLVYNKVDSFSDLEKKVENITDTQVVDVANEIFDSYRLSYLIYE